MHTLNLLNVECPDNILLTNLDYKEHDSFQVIFDSEAYKTNLVSWAKTKDVSLEINKDNNNGQYIALIQKH